jgi:hypothetical protein
VSEKFKFHFRLIFALLGWAAIATDIILRILRLAETGASFISVFSRWRTFTIQVNLMIMLFWTISLIYHNKERKPFFSRPEVKGALAVYITLIFFSYEFILGGLSGLIGSEFILSLIWHYIIPPALILDYLLYTKKKSIKFSHIGYWMIYPLCYSIFLSINGFIYHNYIYSFQNVEQLGLTRVLIYGAGQLLFFVFLGFIYVLLNRHLPGRINIGEKR